MADDTFVALRRIVTLGVRLVDTIDVYAWGLDREFAALRAACALGLRRTNGSDELVRDAAGHADMIGEFGQAGAARERACRNGKRTRWGGVS